MKCPGCLKEGHTTFCNPCKKALFDGKQVDPVLPFESPQDKTMKRFQKHTMRLSISGVQLKYSLQLVDGKLKLTDRNGQYILKPIPVGTFANLDQTPANEHLCMQLAKQIYGLETPPNALVHFKDGSPAYLVKRFDVLPDGSKRRQEDFASLAGKSADDKGDFKYDYSYEGIAHLMQRYIPAYSIEVEKFFRLVVFNYIIGNGDGHLKNFSVSETSFGDHRLSPAYDLLSSKLHIQDDSDMALELFDEHYTKAFEQVGFHTHTDFTAFGARIGMQGKRIEKRIQFMIDQLPSALALIERSFLNDAMKAKLIQQLSDYTLKRLAYRMDG
jgi:serine/threonine-protein kinase HipA